MDAIGWAEKCMLRYSPASILGGVCEESPYHNLVTGDVVTVDVDHYQNVVEGLLRTLPNKTAGGDSQLKFATGEAQVNASQKVYALMQCTPDLPTTDCLGCLYWAMYYALRPDKGQTGARILVPSCTVSDAYGNYTSNSTYKSNLDKLLTNISTTNIPHGFYNFSAGNNPDQVNAIALCRGDIVNVTNCHACIKSVTFNLIVSCPNQMDAIGWGEKCMVRYSAGSILGGVWSDHPMFNLVTAVEVTGDVDHFANVVEDLLKSLPNKTADGDSRLKFATGEANVSASQMVYAMMQCTPDLIPTDCLGCLYWGLYYVLHSDRGQTGARVLLPSCSIRYESQKFYMSSPSSYPARSGRGRGSDISNIVSSVVIVGVLVCLFLLAILLVCFCLRRRRKKLGRSSVKRDDGIEANIIEPLQKDFITIKNATLDFSDENLLGKGSYGAVYKGTLATGEQITVKRLQSSSRQSDEEFKNEVQIAAKLQHTNLAELLGFCLEDNERLLTFAFVHNRSLDYFLFDQERRVQLDWGKRFVIIEGIAQGLLYLHQYSRNKIIHRDLKPANVLLDQDLRPKITDFGTARLFPEDVSHKSTERAAGTRGYMAPEYIEEGKFSTRSDVYSYGILILEILAGRKNVTSTDPDTWLISLAWNNWINGTALDNIVDSTIESRHLQSEMKRCIHIALLCIQKSANSRPKMSRVIQMLTGESPILESPDRPPYVPNNSNPVTLQMSTGSDSDLYPPPKGSMDLTPWS